MVNLWNNREQTRKNITVSDIGHYYYQRQNSPLCLASNTWYSKSGSSARSLRCTLPAGTCCCRLFLWEDDFVHNVNFLSISGLGFLKLKLLAGSWLCTYYQCTITCTLREVQLQNVPVYFSTKNLFRTGAQHTPYSINSLFLNENSLNLSLQFALSVDCMWFVRCRIRPEDCRTRATNKWKYSTQKK